MSDGGGKDNGKEFEQSNARKLAGREDFVRAIAKIAVAQVCESEGFQGFQRSALEALADVAIRYVREIGKTANLSANLAGRSECNVLDVIQGLEDLGSIQGFPGASDVRRSIGSSGIIREISQYVSLAEEIPFAYSLPRFPVSKEHTPPPSFHQLGEELPGEHIPAWLPAFPRPQSHTDFPACNGKETGVSMAREEADDKVLQKDELPSLNMHQGLINNGSLSVFGLECGDSSKMKKAADINPFLAPPLSYEEKEVSVVDHPSRFLDGAAVENHINVMETFAIMVEAAPNKWSEIKEGDKYIKSTGRPTVQLKFNSMRKSLPTSRNVIAWTNRHEKLASYFERDDDKDEKKQRAEQIFKESMENPLGTAQL